MAFNKFYYTLLEWKNKSESLETPIGKNNLNHMDNGIYKIAENLNIAYDELNTGKFSEADAGKVIVGMPTWNPSTGVLTFRFYDGTLFSVDFNIEKIPVSFSMDSAGVITMRTTDGTEWTADIGDAIPDYVFEDSDCITFTKTKQADGSYKVTADIKSNSITDRHLQPSYLADITAQADAASASAKSAGDYADDTAYETKLAMSYAVGGSGVREGEDNDNAKASREAAEKAASDARAALKTIQDVQVTGVKGASEEEYRKGDVNITPENVGAVNKDGDTITGNIVGSAGGQFAIDGNVYLKSQGYDNWLTNYLDKYGQSRGTFTGNIDNLYNTNNNGTYWVASANASGTHPPNIGFYTLIVESVSDGSSTHIAFVYNGDGASPTMYIRSRSNSVWQPWGRLVTTGSNGILPVSSGGTGKATLTTGQVLVGNGTGAISQMEIDSSSYGGIYNSAKLITSGAVAKGKAKLVAHGSKESRTIALDTNFKYIVMAKGNGGSASAATEAIGIYSYSSSGWKNISLIGTGFPGISISGNTMSITYNDSASSYRQTAFAVIGII